MIVIVMASLGDHLDGRLEVLICIDGHHCVQVRVGRVRVHPAVFPERGHAAVRHALDDPDVPGTLPSHILMDIVLLMIPIAIVPER